MRYVKTFALITMVAMLMCASTSCMSVTDGDNDSYVNISSVYFESGVLHVGGTSSASSVVEYVESDNGEYVSEYAVFYTEDGSYSGIHQLGSLDPGTYTVTVFISSSIYTNSEFTVADSSVSVTGVSLDKVSANLSVSGSVVLTATVLPINATDKNVTWSSSDTSVATVGSDGTVTALRAGTCTITVTTSDGAKTAVCSVSVCISGISLNSSSVTIYADSDVTLVATLSPDLSDSIVTWSSSASLLVSVDSNGKLTPKAAGTAEVTAKVGDYVAVCKVTVGYTVIDMDKTSLSLESGDKGLLSVTMPSGYSESYAIWSSSNTSVVSVSGSGSSAEVSGLETGTAIVTATVGSLYKAECDVYVTEPIPVLSKYVFFIKMNLDYNLVTGTNFTENDLRTGFTVSAEGYNAAEALQKACDDNGIPLILYYDDVLRGWVNSMFGLGDVNLGDGVYKYWIQYHDGNYNDWTLGYYTEGGNFSLIYDAATMQDIGVTPVTSIEIIPSTTVSVGDSIVLNAIVNPSNATYKDLTWSSSDSSIVSVGSDGRITGVKVGTATVTVAATDGSGVKSECVITVKSGDSTVVKAEQVLLDKKSASIAVGNSITLIATVLPSDATDKNVTWSSDDESVAVVENGNITALSPGTCTITVTTSDGGFSATCEVTVYNAVNKDVPKGGVVTDDMMSEIIDSVKKTKVDNPDSVSVVELDAPEESSVSIPLSSLKQLSDLDTGIKVVNRLGTIELDSDSLSSLSTVGGDTLRIDASEVDKDTLSDEQKTKVGDNTVYDISTYVGDTSVHELGGTAKITLPYELKDGQDSSKVHIWYLADDGTMTLIDCVFDAGSNSVSFCTDHFSKYVVMYDDSLVEVPSASEDNGMVVWIAVALIVLAVAVAAIMLYRRNTKE